MGQVVYGVSDRIRALLPIGLGRLPRTGIIQATPITTACVRTIETTILFFLPVHLGVEGFPGFYLEIQHRKI